MKICWAATLRKWLQSLLQANEFERPYTERFNHSQLARVIINAEDNPMTTDLDAIYENGAFRPIGKVALPLVNGTRVRLTVEAPQEAEKIPTKESASQQQKQSNGLAALAGGWTDEQWETFEQSVAVTEQVDEELWR